MASTRSSRTTSAAVRQRDRPASRRLLVAQFARPAQGLKHDRPSRRYRTCSKCARSAALSRSRVAADNSPNISSPGSRKQMNGLVLREVYRCFILSMGTDFLRGCSDFRISLITSSLTWPLAGAVRAMPAFFLPWPGRDHRRFAFASLRSLTLPRLMRPLRLLNLSSRGGAGWPARLCPTALRAAELRVVPTKNYVRQY